MLSTPSGSVVTFRGCKLQILVPLSGDQDGMPIFLSFKLATTILSATRRCNVGTINVVTIRNNVATMLQCWVALKIVVANRLV